MLTTILILFVLGTSVWLPKPAYANPPPSCLPVVPNFHVSATPTTLILAPSKTGSSVIALAPFDGFTGTVMLQIISTDTGLTASLSATALDMSNGPQFSILTVTTSSSIAIGSYYVVVNATGGIGYQTLTFTIRVPQPELGITGPLNYPTLQRGTNGTATINLQTYYGLTDTKVALTASVLPGDPSNTPPTVSINSPATLNNGIGSATVNITTTSSTSVATYVVQVVGTTSPSSVTNSTEFFVFVIGPSFDLTGTPQLLAVDAGSSVISTINVTSIRGFAGVVVLTATISPMVTNAPTIALGQSSLMLATAGSQKTTTLNITTTASTPPEEYSIGLVGMAGSIVNRTSLDLTVHGPGFSMTANPGTLTLPRGGGSQVSSTITLSSLGGFADQVGFLMSCEPDGLTGSLSVENVTLSAGGTATAILTVSDFAWTLPGSYDIVIDGSAFTGPQTNGTDITVNVTGPDFSLDLTPSGISFTAGSSATTTVTLSSLDGFAGSVRLTTWVNNPGLNATLSSSTVVVGAGGKGTVTLTVSGASPGRYSVGVTGANGTLLRSAGFNVAVTAVGSPDFGILSSSSSVQAHQGGSGSCTITISPTYGFTGTVYLSIEGSIPINYTLSAQSLTGGSGSSTLTFNVASNVTSGTYTVIVLATSGFLAHYQTVSVVVSNAPGSTILGLDATTFYVVIGVAVGAVAIVAAYLVLRSRKLRRASSTGNVSPQSSSSSLS